MLDITNSKRVIRPNLKAVSPYIKKCEIEERSNSRKESQIKTCLNCTQPDCKAGWCKKLGLKKIIRKKEIYHGKGN